MKNSKRFLLIFLVQILFLYCSKSKEDDNTIIYMPGPQTNGWSTAFKNGLEWAATATARKFPLDTTALNLHFFTYNSEGALREYIFITTPLKAGKYDTDFFVEENEFRVSAGIMGSDGDVVEAGYTLDENENNFIDITSLDTLTGKVAGGFPFFFLNKKDNSSHPQSFKLEQGEFEVTMTDE